MRLPYNLRSGHAQREKRCHSFRSSVVAVRECVFPLVAKMALVRKVRSQNGASGMSDIGGSEPDWQLAARVAASECGQRASFNEG